ncbi:MAG: ribbon-helix-helix domain-containing protein [Chitinispirillaceae bacterium]|nr:ribbon-helix-helix domain-containing protein [Chitinispirillaceae bacterium]
MGQVILKNRKPFSNAMDKSLYDKFNEISKTTKIPKSRLLDEGIEYIIIKYCPELMEK